MQSKWLEHNDLYDGTQLAPLKNYLSHDLLGDSIISWQGPCEVKTDHMIDGEDLKQNSKIAGDNMLHFILELFDFPLTSAVTLQRLIGEILIKKIKETSTQPVHLERRGDDLYQEDKKLNISIATCSTNSSLIHFAINITNKGTPVKTCALQDFQIENPKTFAQTTMEAIKKEYQQIKKATQKVRTF